MTCYFGTQAVKSINLTHEGTLSDPAHGRIARQLADGAEVLRKEKCPCACACSSCGSLAPGMAASNHTY